MRVGLFCFIAFQIGYQIKYCAISYFYESSDSTLMQVDLQYIVKA